MPQMPTAHRTKNFGPGIAQEMINRSFDILGLRRIVEGRPPAPGIELFLGRKEFGVTSGTEIGAPALLLKFMVNFTVWPFRARFSKDAILFRR